MGYSYRRTEKPTRRPSDAEQFMEDFERRVEIINEHAEIKERLSKLLSKRAGMMKLYRESKAELDREIRCTQLALARRAAHLPPEPEPVKVGNIFEMPGGPVAAVRNLTQKGN